jgi:hypothetical protein
MDGELTLTTTTDAEAIVQAAAEGNEQGARIPGPQTDDFSSVSVEDSRSERNMLLERLAQHEAELESLSDAANETVASNEPSSELNGEGTAERVDIDLEEIRRVATADAIAAARARVAQQEADAFGQRMRELEKTTPNFRELSEQAGEIAIPATCAETLRSRPGGAEAWLWLAGHPQEAQNLLLWPEHVAIAEVALLAAKLDPAAQVRVTSRAPAPIRPLSGAGVRTAAPDLGELSYAEYRQKRDEQIKARRR